LKGPGSKRTGALFGSWVSGSGGLACGAKHVWLLSATPCPNDPSELYSALKFFGAWKASYTEFLDRFTKYDTDQFGGIRIKGVRNSQELRSMLKPYVLRRKKADVLPDLPPLTLSELPVEGKELDPSHPVMKTLREMEPQHAESIYAAVDSGDWSLCDVEHIASVRRLVGLLKVRSTAEIVAHELDSGRQNVVIFGVHCVVLNGLAHILDRFGVGVIQGSTPNQAREDALTLFDAGVFRVLLLQIRTAGAGITITSSDNLIMAESSWTPADNIQAVARLHRMGQKNPVTARFASLAESIDEKVSSALVRKMATLAEIGF
jgi:SWI/SNF-related matrix-associated actin-dependent regulator of chromatin subfamily A-like protein 1